MEIDAVNRSYKRWAPVYDRTFGAITGAGRRRAVQYINTREGAVLEVGVGTGLSLGDYQPHLKVSGVDISDDMLAKARAKVERLGLSHVDTLAVMDARVLEFPDASFDTVVGMYLVSVVPEPEKVVAEMARVCKPGGEVLIVNHFAREKGMLSVLERTFAPMANLLGWHSDFPRERIMGVPELKLEETMNFPPFGMFSFLRFRKAG
ncbi:class I SAM-dependent methyltransferase [Alkalilacustris brevis]|uniref:class I SAM-dependent methyltransferase n=1 Tax=Alkalilacustris brevis TaxID=2026338 RepID=UPI000E0DA778|nr:class I SAM-dependent methyltransferase [Alkalilacustris brevis]